MEKACPNEAFIGTYNAEVEASDDFVVEGEFQELEHLENTIARSLGLTRCETCGGMEVDLGNERIYCGLDVPAEVMERIDSIMEWEEVD